MTVINAQKQLIAEENMAKNFRVVPVNVERVDEQYHTDNIVVSEIVQSGIR